jgi:hypothetical protein
VRLAAVAAAALVLAGVAAAAPPRYGVVVPGRSLGGVRLGATAAQVTTLYPGVTRRDCAGYYLLFLRTRAGVTEFLILDGRLWGLAVSRAPEPCR